MIVGSVGLTGIGIRISQLLISISGGNMIILLGLTALAGIILSMGLPWVACYILLATLLAPALITAGALPQAAHLFVFYMGAIAMLTPPVCTAVYIASGIANSRPMRTGYQAMRLGIAAFIVPFVFVFQPGLLLMGSISEILLAVLTGAFGISALAVGLEGYITKPVNSPQRVLFLASGVSLILPSLASDIIGFSILALVTVWYLIGTTGRSRPEPTPI